MVMQMITVKGLKAVLEDIGIPYAYYAFPVGEAPPLPFLVYLVEDSSNFIADNHVYKRITQGFIELYTAYKDFGTEAQVEDALDEAEIVWEKSSSYKTDDRTYATIYRFMVDTDG